MTTGSEHTSLSELVSVWSVTPAAHNHGASFIHLLPQNAIGTTTTTNAALSNLDAYALTHTTNNPP